VLNVRWSFPACLRIEIDGDKGIFDLDARLSILRIYSSIFHDNSTQRVLQAHAASGAINQVPGRVLISNVRFAAKRRFHFFNGGTAMLAATDAPRLLLFWSRFLVLHCFGILSTTLH